MQFDQGQLKTLHGYTRANKHTQAPGDRRADGRADRIRGHAQFADENDTRVRTVVLQNGTIHHFYPKIVYDHRIWE